MSYPSYDLTLQNAIWRQREWSEKAFGPGKRTKGIADHIRKELIEVEQSDGSAEEWIDVLLLTLDALWRTGYDPESVENLFKSKIQENSKRTWPDWRTKSEDEAIEHVRTPDEQARKDAEAAGGAP